MIGSPVPLWVKAAIEGIMFNVSLDLTNSIKESQSFDY